ncbi:hypothetical protein [Anaerococcus sp. AGMB09787]|uniref:hypothetical protein n=1 Tax=Anaerococcus sp. AGMB09787 TaxID=2922869 RepID=UPI001FAF70AD|nr:hypothetical protein [Anaerococcus sp. AGMB09787]
MKNKSMSFGWYALYVSTPTLIFLISRIFMKGFDTVFTFLFAAVVTLSSVSAYYLTNKSFNKIRSDRMIGITIPLAFVLMVVLAILINILI